MRRSQLEQLQAEHFDMACTRGRDNPPVLVGASSSSQRYSLVAPGGDFGPLGSKGGQPRSSGKGWPPKSAARDWDSALPLTSTGGAGVAGTASVAHFPTPSRARAASSL